MVSSSRTIWHIDTKASGVLNIARTLPGWIPGASAYFAPDDLLVGRFRAFWRAMCKDGIMSTHSAPLRYQFAPCLEDSMAGFMSSLLEPSKLSATTTAAKPKKTPKMKAMEKPAVATGPQVAQKPFDPKGMRRQMLRTLVGGKRKK